MSRVLVTHDNYQEALASLRSITSGVIGLDTETYGLKWDDKLFALQLVIQGGDSFYFNFHEYNDGSPVLPRSVFAELHDLWRRPDIRWIMANAKFDLRRIAIEGVVLNGEVYDVLLMDRIRYNRNFSYSLDAVLKRMGLSKNDEVGLWIKDNKAYTSYAVDGKKTKERDLHYDRVPFHIMFRYGLDDVELTLKIYEDQCNYFQMPENKEQIDLVHSNIELVKTVFAMETAGIQLSIPYCKEMLEREIIGVATKADLIEQMTQRKFKAGPKWLAEVLREQGVTLEISDKGNPILDKNALNGISNAVAHYVLEMRDHEKRAGTYQALLRFADKHGVLHTNYRLNGTDTLRFSSNDPNLQNIEACKKGDPYTVRSAFVPREGAFLVSIDYRAMEYRLVADIAGEHGWIEAISSGTDPHQWVADLMGTDRKSAKTLNFMLLYGGGLAKLALSLFECKTNEETLKAICMVHIYKSKRVKPAELALVNSVPMDILHHEIEQLTKADKLKKLYFESLPKVADLTKKIMEVGVERGYVRNAFGMRYFVDQPQFAYKLPNHLIQGTGACVIRGAMNKLAFFLDGTKSRMLLQIHDELLLEIDKADLHLVPEIRRIMEDEYRPINGMKLECDVEVSETSWNSNSFIKWEDNEF
jgi:DNA polymerase-1